MTNAYFDTARPAQYRGGFRICGQCFTVVPSTYWDKHVTRCNELEDLIEHPASLEIDDIDTEEPATPEPSTAGGL